MTRIHRKEKSFVQGVAEDLFRAATEVAKERAREIIRELAAVSKEKAKIQAKREKELIVDADFEDVIPSKKVLHELLPARTKRLKTRTSESSSVEKEP